MLAGNYKNILFITHLHSDCAATYHCVVLLCADLWQVGSGGEVSLAAVQYGAVISVVAQFKQQAAILKPLNQT